MTVRWLSYDAAIDGPQIVASLAHALRMKELHRAILPPVARRLLDRAIWDRYMLCHDLGLGVDADTLVFKHRSAVAR